MSIITYCICECCYEKQLFIMTDFNITSEGGDPLQDASTNNILSPKRTIIENNHGEERIRPGVSLLQVNFN